MYRNVLSIINNAVAHFDGYHAIKVKDENVLSDYLYACSVPDNIRMKDMLIKKV